MRSFPLGLLLLLSLAAPALADDGNRLAYLDGNNPYHVSRRSPKLTTPMWVGEEGVEAVVVLAIDDMRGPDKWEKYLRPILQRLKRIDGRAPVSIMTCQIDPEHPHLQTWLEEGLSLETHTIDHPCPMLQRGDLARAKSTFDRCVDLLSRVPKSKPVAFRVPCCDSLNTPSPRFYAEIFNKVTPAGNFVSLDSSVFTLLTPDDPELPRDLVIDPEGRERFRKYLPADRSFVNYVEDYPYPFVIARLCWEFPCIVPSDWEAQHLNKPYHPITVRDMQAAIDAVVRKRGTFNLVFHPHGWIKNTQVIDLIDHAVTRHGKKVKFLTFREAHDRLNRFLLGGQPLRRSDGRDNGVRILDVNADGFVDVVIGNAKVRKTRLWQPEKKAWKELPFPTMIVDAEGRDAGVRFGIVRADGKASLLVSNGKAAGGWHFDGKDWVEDKALLRGLEVDSKPLFTSRAGRDQGIRLHDLDGDGVCELVAGNGKASAIFRWTDAGWKRLPFRLPPGTSIVDKEGHDAGLRFVDIDEDGDEDVMASNDERYGLYLFTSMKEGWSRKVLAGKAGEERALPRFVRKGTDNGAWFHSRHLWVQNENTGGLLKDHVARRAFNDLLKDVVPEAKSPEASLRCLKPRPGFVAELVASEPLVQDPVAFAWGPDGKFWVAEMGDYPSGIDGKGKPGGHIKFLEDTDGDGKYDKMTLFLDNVPFPTGVTPWRKGVLITAAPDILYAEDTDGDGKADRKLTLYTGFVEGNQQHRVNGLVWGLDNWIHCANGDSGGRVKSLKTGDIVNISGRDLRIRPDTGALDAQTGQSQFGRCRDDWGDWFGGNNSNPLWHFVLADQYLRRNPHLRPPNLRVNVPEVAGNAPVFPISRPLPRFNDFHTLNHFTSACSPIVYRDDLFGPAFAENVFISEPVHNMVHREVMRPEGFTFRSRRAIGEREAEFLASSDNWFRPTLIRIGPDGALWVADMYRHVIEHPKWIPEEWQRKLDLRAGADRGRIYRVYPVGTKPRAIPRLDKLDTAGLVAALDHPGGWQRDTIQQMLLWKGDKEAIPLLRKLARKAKRPQARLQALCTLDGLKGLNEDVLKGALSDPHPGVRRHAIRLSEGLLGKDAELGAALLGRVKDEDAQVRVQLAYTLGEWDDPRAGEALGVLLLGGAEDPYLTTAALSSVNKKNLDGVLLAVLRGKGEGPVRGEVLGRLLGLAGALGHEKALATLIGSVGKAEGGKYAGWQFDALAGLLDHLDARRSTLEGLRKGGSKEVQSAVDGLAGLFAEARKLAAGEKADSPLRARAVRVLGGGIDHREKDLELLGALLVPRTPLSVQEAAVESLGRLRSGRVPEVLLKGWRSYSPGLRGRVLDVLLQRRAWVGPLVGAIEKETVLATEIDAARRQRLLRDRDPAVRERATKLFAGGGKAERAKVVRAYQPVLSLKGEAARGRPLFVKNCAVCHRLGGDGPAAGAKAAGPDLEPLASKPADYLLIAILDPNRAVEARYVSYLAELKSGVTLSGVLAAETGTSLTLVAQDGKEHVLLRADVETLVSTGVSAMPEGLEKDLEPQDLADLLAYVRSRGEAKK